MQNPVARYPFVAKSSIDTNPLTLLNTTALCIPVQSLCVSVARERNVVKDHDGPTAVTWIDR